MRAELLKLRTLPTPRWTLVVCLACTAVALVVTAIAGVGEDQDVAIGLGVELPTAIAAIVLGAWIVGLEHGSGTMRRTLTADPRRARVFGAKVAVACLASLGLTVACFAVVAVGFPIAAGDESDRHAGDLLLVLVAAIPGNLTGCAIGAAIALLTRSMAGGMTVALLAVLVLGSALTAIPAVGDYTIGTAQLDIYDAIRDRGDPDLLRGIVVSAVWLAVLGTVSVGRFVRSDV